MFDQFISKDTTQFEAIFFGAIIMLISLLLSPLGLAYALNYLLIRMDPFLYEKITLKTRAILCSITSVIGSSMCFLGYYSYSPQEKIFYVYFGFGMLCSFLGVLFLAGPLIYRNKIDKRFKISQLNNKVNFKDFDEYLEDPDHVPVAISLTNKKMITIPVDERNLHSQIVGGSGYGKTSTAMTLIRHDLRWGRPVFFIDPKGGKGDVETIRELARIHGREEDVEVFSLVDGKGNFSYDPLLIGGPHTKADKLCYALELNHEHYGKLANAFLTFIFSYYEFKNSVITIEDLYEAVISKEKITQIIEDLEALVKDNPEYKTLLVQARDIKSIKLDELRGLSSGLSGLLNHKTKHLFNDSKEFNSINIEKAITESKIVLLDIPAGEQPRLSATIGRILLRDFEIIAGKLQTEALQHNHRFIPIYCDEFDSFANVDFHIFMKTARSANISLNLLYQTTEGLRGIDDTFTGKVTALAKYSFHFRAKESADIDKLIKLAGAEVRKHRSTQINKHGFFSDKTGMGTESEVSTYIIDPQVVKKLKKGQAFFLGESVELIQLWNSREVLKTVKMTKEQPRISKIVPNPPKSMASDLI